MTGRQWETLLAVINGEPVEPVPVGFIIDSPWLPGWAGISTLDYYSSERMWFEANLKAVERFPRVMFLPGFWAEFGMCTEPSAFGARCSWRQRELPFAGRVLDDIARAGELVRPDPRADGLPPFVLNRLRHYQADIAAAGHAIRFAVARGPLNVASFLAGGTEFLMAVRTDPDNVHKLLGLVTDFLIDWLKVQAETFTTIDGVLVLDDIVGFLGEDDFRGLALPYLARLFGALDVAVRFFHNDAGGLICAPYLGQMGVNLFNFSFEHGLAQMRKLAGGSVTLLGNVPTRDVLAAGSPEQVRQAVRAALDSLPDKRRLVLSCGGGMPPGVSSENIEAFVAAAG